MSGVAGSRSVAAAAITDAPAGLLALQATVLDLDRDDGDRLRARLGMCPGVDYTLVDAHSAYVYVEFRAPCTEERIVSILRATGRPVLTGPGCC